MLEFIVYYMIVPALASMTGVFIGGTLALRKVINKN